MDAYEEVRYQLQKLKLIKNGPTDKTRVCSMNKLSKNCHICTATHICTSEDKLTGQKSNTYGTPEINLQHQIGGGKGGQGMKDLMCYFPDSCRSLKRDEEYIPIEEYRQAATPQELCNATHEYVSSKKKEK